MNCNFKFLICSNIFLITGNDRSCIAQNIKVLNKIKVQDAITIRRRNITHRTPCKTSRLDFVVSLVMQNNKKVVELDVAHCGARDRCQTCSFSLTNIDYRAPETRIDPCLIFLSRFDRMHVELVGAKKMCIEVPVEAANFARNLV